MDSNIYLQRDVKNARPKETRRATCFFFPLSGKSLNANSPRLVRLLHVKYYM